MIVRGCVQAELLICEIAEVAGENKHAAEQEVDAALNPRRDAKKQPGGRIR
jgi:hypothetical protein